ncbi:MAG: polysaccharide biosynthesis tyrosine autokinase [Acidimicrobiales bacterium]
MSQQTDFDDELELSDYLRILWRRWPWVLLPFVLIVGLATAFTVRQPAVYCSTAQVYVAPSAAQQAIEGDLNVFVASRSLSNEINVAYSDLVRGAVVSDLGLDPEVRVTGDADSDVLWFRGCGATADQGALYSNTWAGTYVDTKQQQAAGSISSAVDGFQDRIAELRIRRQETRLPLDTLEDRLAAATPDSAAASRLQVDVDRLRADLAVELGLIDAQIQTVAGNVTALQLSSELARAGTASVTQVAAPAIAPSNAPLSRNLVLGGVIGLILGAAAALLVENLDRSIKTADDIAGVPVLGSIPRPGRDMAGVDLSLATMNYTGSAVAEGYQKVRTALEFALLGRKITSLLITSPDQAEGKTTTSANLAWAMSAVDHRVVLADVDFRRPRIHDVFGCPPEPGLSDNLLHGTPLNKLALRVDDERSNMVIIPTGAQPPSPGDFVASPAFSGLLRNLEAEADLVILDSPPVLPVSDALSIARQVDGVIIAARAGKTSSSDLAKAVENLRAVGADVLGVCLIGVKSDHPQYGYGYGYGRNKKARKSKSRRQRTPNVPKQIVEVTPELNGGDSTNGGRKNIRIGGSSAKS